MSRRAEGWLWAAFFVLQLAPVWALGYFPTQDGPSHLENANILLLLHRGDAPVFQEYFSVNTAPTPNWLGHAVLAGLILVAGPMIAEKLMLTIYIVALPLAVRYAFRVVRPDSGPLAVVTFPFLYNCLLHYGFYNFCLSIAVFFVAIGYWSSGKRNMGVLSAILTVLYGCHVVSWGLALIALVIMRPRETARLALAAAPSAALALWFFAGRQGGAPGTPVSVAARWSGLWHFSTAVSSYAAADQWVGAAFAVFLVCAAVRSKLQPQAIFSAVLLLLYFAIPPQAFGGMFLLERLNLYFFLSLLLWIAETAWSRGGRIVLISASAALCIAILILNAPWYLEANRLIAEYVSGAAKIQPGSVFVPLIYNARGPGPMRQLYGEPLRHASSYVAVMRGAVNLDNYEAQTELFPVKFRPDRNPGVFVGAMEESPPRVRLDSSRIDYVLVWDPMRVAPDPPPRFQRVFESKSGALVLYE